MWKWTAVLENFKNWCLEYCWKSTQDFLLLHVITIYFIKESLLFLTDCVFQDVHKRKHALHMNRLWNTEHYTSYLSHEKWQIEGVWPNIGQNLHSNDNVVLLPFKNTSMFTRLVSRTYPIALAWESNTYNNNILSMILMMTEYWHTWDSAYCYHDPYEDHDKGSALQKW